MKARRSAWGLAPPDDYLRLELRAHALLADVPLHDVWRVDLPGGGPGRTIADVRSAMRALRSTSLGPVVRFLFALRSLAGRILRLDAPRTGAGSPSMIERLSDEDRRRSIEPPGSADGPFTVLYVHPAEAVSEVRNATVHAMLVFALQPVTPSDYRLFWAVYVKPVGRITAVYMALIDPFRRLLVYPAILRRLRRSWIEAHGGATGRRSESSRIDAD